MILSIETFYWILRAMIVVAALVFVVLFFVEAGYGMMISPKWGPSISNKWAWTFMEAPVFIAMCVFCFASPRHNDLMPMVFFGIFQLHYFQRSFIFPWLMKGRSRMPLSIMFMGIVFNLLNGCIQGSWIFFLSPEGMYSNAWASDPRFIIGCCIFAAGFLINLSSDYIIRHLRKDGDTAHYFPSKGMFKYVTSANYFGELTEWLGFAVLTWSMAGLVFFIWTLANLVPRANAIYHRYQKEFPQEMAQLKPKRVFPFIY